MKNVGVIKFSKKLLAELLFLPEGTNIIASNESNTRSGRDGYISLVVESEDIPSRREGELYPEIMMEVTQNANKQIISKFIFKEGE